MEETYYPNDRKLTEIELRDILTEMLSPPLKPENVDDMIRVIQNGNYQCEGTIIFNRQHMSGDLYGGYVREWMEKGAKFLVRLYYYSDVVPKPLIRKIETEVKPKHNISSLYNNDTGDGVELIVSGLRRWSYKQSIKIQAFGGLNQNNCLKWMPREFKGEAEQMALDFDKRPEPTPDTPEEANEAVGLPKAFGDVLRASLTS